MVPPWTVNGCSIYGFKVVSTQAEKMRAELANLNHCAVLFLSRATVNLSWYDSIYYANLRLILSALFYSVHV